MATKKAYPLNKDYLADNNRTRIYCKK